MYSERSIKFAFDKVTGEIIDADDIFDDRLTGFEIRKKYNQNEIIPHCLECENQLSVSISIYDRIYFKHYPTEDFCFLKDENLSPKEKSEFYDILKSKESERHKYLKNRIGELLLKIEGISEVNIDNQFIFDGNNKRKPDVFCKYYDKKIVFEIQLSSLSQRYILSRHNFYKAKGIYLIWILDNFDVLGQTQTEKDIKYLSKHQNFFKLNEDAEEFNLTCKYKFTFLSSENKFMDKWNEVYIPIEKLKFDSDNYEVYFYNFNQQKDVIIELQKKNQEKINAEKLKQELAEQEKKKIDDDLKAKKRLNAKIDEVLYEIKRLKDKQIAVYDSVTNLLREFEENELEAFNLRLNLDKNNKICEWITKGTQKDFSFIKFILQSSYIEYDCNLIRDDIGNTIINFLYNNKELPFLYFFKMLLIRGYKFKKEDEILIIESFPNELHKANSLITVSYLANQFENNNFIKYLLDFEKIVCIIESAKQGKIIGYKYKSNEWLNFANNVLEYHSSYWEYVELAFKQFGLFDKITQLDTKKSFQKKLFIYYSKDIKTDYSFDYLFGALYPEIGEINRLKL